MEYEFFELPVFYEADVIPMRCRKSRPLSCVEMNNFYIEKTNEMELVGITVGYNNMIEAYYKNGEDFYVISGLNTYDVDETISKYVEHIPHLNEQEAQYKKKQSTNEYIEGIQSNFNNVYNPEKLRHHITQYFYLGFPYKIENFENPLIEQQDIKTILVDNKEKYIKEIQNKLNKYKIHNGIIFEKTEEPKILLNHSGGLIDRPNSNRRLITLANRNFSKNSDEYKRQYFSFSMSEIDMAYNLAQKINDKDQYKTNPAVSSENNFIIINPDAFNQNPYKTIMINMINIPGYNFFNIIKSSFGEEKKKSFINMVYNISQNGYQKEDVEFFIESLVPLTQLSSIKDFLVNNGKMMMESIKDEPKSNILFNHQEDKFNLKPGIIEIPSLEEKRSPFKIN